MKQIEMTNGRSTILVAEDKVERMESIGWTEVNWIEVEPVVEEIELDDPAE